jgi:hypothetical protein
MSIQELTYISAITFAALALIPTVCVYFFPGSMNERLWRSLEALDQERIGAEKRYIVHYKRLRMLMDAGPFFCFIIFGLFFISFPLFTAHFTSWDEVNVRMIMIAWISGIIFAFLFPLGCYISFIITTSKFLVVTENGFEVWKIRRKGICMLYSVRWRDVSKIIVSRQYQGFDADLLGVYTGKKRVILKTNWPNMLPFLKDLSVKAAETVRKADGYTIARIEYNINNPKSEARKEASSTGHMQDARPEANQASKGSKALLLFGTGYLVFWTAIVLLVSILEIDVPVMLLAIPFLGCIGFIAWGLLRIRRLKKADSTL